MSQRGFRDRSYHNAIAAQYDRVVVWPRWHSINWLFVDAPKQLPDSKRSMLDIGCGTGHMVMRFGHMFDEVVAVDHSIQMLGQVTKNYAHPSNKNLELVNADVEEFVRNDTRQYDLITCVGFAHHLEPEALVSLFRNVRMRLNKGGVFLIAEPITGISANEPQWLSRWNSWYRSNPELYATDAVDPEEGPIDLEHLRSSLASAGLKRVHERRGWEVFPQNLPPSVIDKVMIPIICRMIGNSGPILCTYCRAD